MESHGTSRFSKEDDRSSDCVRVDYCKFQTWRVENLKEGPWNKDGRIEIYQKAELKDQDYIELIEHCKK